MTTHHDKVRALTDIWVFADIINYHGGSKEFSQVHKEAMAFLAAHQVRMDELTSQGVWSAKELAEQLNNKDFRRLLMLPRGHLKSTLLVLYVMWRIYRNPNIRVLFGTDKKKLAQSFIRQLRQYFEDAELQESVWNNRPHIDGLMIPVLDAAGKRRRESSRGEEDSEAEDKKVIWNLAAIQVIRPERYKEPTVFATSVGTTVTGDHYDLIILDDIVNFKNSVNALLREKLADWSGDLESVLNTLKDNARHSFSQKRVRLMEILGDELIVTGTRYFGGDYYDTILDTADEIEYGIFTRNIYKNGKDRTDGYTYPEGFNERTEMLLRKRLTARRFAAQYLNEIMSDEERVFHIDNINWIPDQYVTVEKGRVFIRGDINLSTAALENGIQLNKTSDVQAVEIRPFMTVDPSLGNTRASDYTAIVIGGYDHLQNLYILDIIYGRWKPSELITKIWEALDKWGLVRFSLDTNGVGAMLPQAFREHLANTRKRPVIIDKFMRPSVSPVAKIDWIEDTLEPFIESGRLHVVASQKKNTELKDELYLFPRSAHDDILDAISMLAVVAGATRQRANPNKNHTTNTSRNRRVNSLFGGVL